MYPMWDIFCKPVWSDSGAISNGFHNYDGTGMSEWVPVENTGKHCIWSQSQGVAGKGNATGKFFDIKFYGTPKLCFIGF